MCDMDAPAHVKYRPTVETLAYRISNMLVLSANTIAATRSAMIYLRVFHTGSKRHNKKIYLTENQARLPM
jgi:hypothetical protein